MGGDTKKKHTPLHLHEETSAPAPSVNNLSRRKYGSKTKGKTKAAVPRPSDHMSRFVAQIDAISPETRGDMKVCWPKGNWAGPEDVKAVT